MMVLKHSSKRVNGVTLHYVTAGQGDPLVLLHGWPQTWYAWRNVIPLLAERYTVIAPDLRGFGDSEKPEYGYDKRTVSVDIHELVHALGYRSIVLVGHDLGGQVAYPYAAQWPEEVRALVYIESSLPSFGQEELMDVAKDGSWHFGFNMAGDIAEALVQGKERILIEHWMRRSGVAAVDSSTVTSDALDQYAHQLAQPGGLRASFAHYRAIPRDRLDNLDFARRKLQMPVLAIEGDHGFPGGPLYAMKQVASDVQNAVIAESGHYPAEERPEDLVKCILGFLDDKVFR